MVGWGTAIGKIFDLIPGRKERYRNNVENLKRKMDEIQKKKPYTSADAVKYNNLATRLRVLEQKTKNI